MQTNDIQTTIIVPVADSVCTPLCKALPKDTTPPKLEETFLSKFFSQQSIEQSKGDSARYRQSLFLGHQLQVKSRGYKDFNSSNNIIISLLLLSFLCVLAILYRQYKNRLSNYFKACFSTRQLLQIRKDSNIQTESRHILSSLFLALIWALVMVRSTRFLGLVDSHQFTETLLFFVSFAAFFVFLEIKYIWAFCLSFLFEDREMFSNYTSHIIVSYFIYGFLVLPFLTLSYLSNMKFSDFFLQMSLVVLGMSYFIYLFRSLVVFFSFSKLSKLYLFLYLCTVEIIPLLIAIKLAVILF